MRNYFSHVFLLCLLVVSFGCSSPLADLKTNTPVFDEAKESAAIYSAAIKYAAANGEHGFVPPLFISSNSISDTTFRWEGYPLNDDTRLEELKRRYSSVNEEVLHSYLLKHREPFKFDPRTNLTLASPYEFVEGDLVDAELQKPVLGGEPSKLPGPVLRLSRIGFNSSYDQAFFQMEYVACPLCGFGAHFSLEKIDGEWKIKESFEGWIS